MSNPKRRVLKWDPYEEPGDGDMEFKLTYAGALLAHRDDKRLAERSLHVHALRKAFHPQIRAAWERHPVLMQARRIAAENGGKSLIYETFAHDGFNWVPVVNAAGGMTCGLDILMLRDEAPGNVPYDLDNRVKTVFDALRKAKGPQELGENTQSGMMKAGVDEDPFFVLLEDDSLITRVSVANDMLLEPVPGVPPADAARLVINVTVRPRHSHLANVHFT